MDDFTLAYIECALWTLPVEHPSTVYTCDDLAPETLQKMEEDCRKFQEENATLFLQVYDSRPDYDESNAGHDFWLTRNGHGAGFWDRGLDDIGEALSEKARAFGECELYVGDDGKIYHCGG
jgi:hypothetical protein